jgi:valyl-tRNA synthetase
MELSTRYQPKDIEAKWYQQWLDLGVFHSEPNPDKESYTIVIPPPNVTGVLHMGHMLNNTIQDILVRRARMQGKEACWVPGTDHASIATEAKVVAMLKEQGIHKEKISREQFLEHAWEWKEKYGGIILSQLKKLGASCDWERTRFTMETDLYDAVQDVFIDLFNKGQIYRGIRMVNWDPKGRTALSDDEVIHKEINSRLYYIDYPIEGAAFEHVTIATVRPETIMADAAICVHPEDERFTHLIGKNAIIPLIDRPIPIIADSYVDPEFGTGCLKVTPAHDINDYEIGIRHNLDVIDLLDDDGRLNEHAKIFVGEDRFVARKMIAKELEKKGYLSKTEDYRTKVGCSERTDAVVEPRLSMQWFLKMEELTKPALEHVMNDDVQLHPAKFKNMYRSWMENVRDWCISRQLWWGHRIPAWYGPMGRIVAAKDLESAKENYAKKYGEEVDDLIQDEDVLDTWFSSWLWPISVFDSKVFSGAEPNEELKYYFPTADLVTAPEILFFWVARMVMAGYEYMDDKPFKNVYLTGIVRDKQGRKMSKSLGNSPDPLELIEQYGADAVRTGMLFSSPAGNDLLYDEKLIEQGRNFANKIWNAFRLVQGWEGASDIEQTAVEKEALEWFENRIYQAIEELEDAFADFRMADALMILYRLIWDEYCGWFLEAVKPADGRMAASTFEAVKELFDTLLRLLHPFMPFLTEELWQGLKARGEKETICTAEYPQKQSWTNDAVQRFENSREAITLIRGQRSQRGMSPKQALEVSYTGVMDFYSELLKKLANLDKLEAAKEAPEGMSSIRVKKTEYYLDMGDHHNPEEEKAKLEKELAYLQGFYKSVNAKLSNERFVSGAPMVVVDREKAKLADAEAKIKAIEEQLGRM